MLGLCFGAYSLRNILHRVISPPLIGPPPIRCYLVVPGALLASAYVLYIL
jgi:hypothetical protein